MEMDFLGLLKHLMNPSSTIGAATYAVLIFGISLVFAHAVRLALMRSAKHHFNFTGFNFVVQIIQIAIVLAGLVLYAHLIPGLRSLGSTLLAGAGIVSIIVGVAAQRTLGNLISGFSLLFYHPVQIGDRVQVITTYGIQEGKVSSLSLGYTILTRSTSEEILVPNSIMADAVLVRVGAQDPETE